jgi:hypothetical protein
MTVHAQVTATNVKISFFAQHRHDRDRQDRIKKMLVRRNRVHSFPILNRIVTYLNLRGGLRLR